MPSWFNWMSALIGILFAMFVMPLLSQMLGRMRSNSTMKKAA